VAAKKVTVKPDKVHTTIAGHMLADGFDVVLDLEKSKGTRMFDSRSGKYLLDFFTCFASSPIGFNHPRLTEPDFVARLGRVAINKPANSDLYTTEMAEFVETFGTLAAPAELPNLFFVSGGAVAVENALKTAFDWKVRKNIAKGVNSFDTPEGQLKGQKIIHFEQAFHGRTGYTLALTNTFDPRKTQYFPKLKWPRVLNPKARFPLEDKNLDNVMAAEKESVGQIKKALADNPDDVAAIIIEPIQGEGGDNHFRPEFLQALREIADDSDVMLIFDEVQSGMGLTGTMWAFQQMGMTPDIACFGKKTQVCGIMVSERVREAKDNVFEMSSRINSTWGGNLIDMGRCTRYLEVIDEENMLENAATQGARMLEGFRGIDDDKIANVRGRGLMCAFDLPTTEMRNTFIPKLRENGTFALPCGASTVRFRPPLNILPEEVDEAVASIEKTIKAM